MRTTVAMKGISAGVCKGLKKYWNRRGYQRLNGSGRRRRTRVELGSTRRGRFWRIRIAPKIRFLRKASPKKLLVWLRDAYVRMMMSLANSRLMTMGGTAAGFGGVGFRRPPLKEYDEKMIVQIYKSLMMAQGQLGPRDAAKLSSEILSRRLEE